MIPIPENLFEMYRKMNEEKKQREENDLFNDPEVQRKRDDYLKQFEAYESQREAYEAG